MRQLLCQLCGAACDDAFPCRCRALYFCSRRHLEIFATPSSASASASAPPLHSPEDCARLGEQLAKGGPELDALLTSVAPSLMTRDSIGKDACTLMRAAGVHRRGLYRSCCGCDGDGAAGLLSSAGDATAPSSCLDPVSNPPSGDGGEGEEAGGSGGGGGGRSGDGDDQGPQSLPEERTTKRIMLATTAAAFPSLESVLLFPDRDGGGEEGGGQGEKEGRPVVALPLASSSPPKDWREYLSRRLAFSPSSPTAAADDDDGDNNNNNNDKASPSEASTAPAATDDDNKAPCSLRPCRRLEEEATVASAMLLLHRPLTASMALAAAYWWGGSSGKGGGGRRRRKKSGEAEEEEDNGDDDGENKNDNDNPFVLHVVGASADAEAAQWLCWLELARLGGGGGGGENERGRRRRSLVVVLVGPTVSRSSASFPIPNSESRATITIEFAKGKYHDVSSKIAPPDAVFLPDAGLAAGFEESWRPTLRSLFLMSLRRSSRRGRFPPVLVTDLTEEAALLAAAAVSKVVAEVEGEGEEEEERNGENGKRKRRHRRLHVTEPQINPFRSPARLRAPGGSALPAAEGGWCFWVMEEGGEEGGE